MRQTQRTAFRRYTNWTTSLFLALLLPIGILGSVFPEQQFELLGRVVFPGGHPFQGAVPVAVIDGVRVPFSANTLVDAGGKFKFKRLQAGTYRLAIFVPRWGEVSRTIEIGPSLADPEGRIRIEIQFDLSKVDKSSATVSVWELTVDPKALKEYRKAVDCLERWDAACAARRFEKAVVVDPSFAAAWNELGKIAYQAKDYPEAERLFRKALEVAPDAFLPRVNLAGAVYSQGRIEEALELNLEAVMIKPDDPTARSQLGQCYLKLGRLEEAERELKLAKGIDPAHFSCPQIFLAEIYLANGNSSAAVEELEQFLELHPDSRLGEQVRKWLENIRPVPE